MQRTPRHSTSPAPVVAGQGRSRPDRPQPEGPGESGHCAGTHTAPGDENAQDTSQLMFDFNPSPKHRPQVVIVHSLGTVVTYEALHAHPELNVELLLTLGAPLAMPRAVFDRLNPHPTSSSAPLGARPASLARWVNIADPGDPVAIPPSLHAPSPASPWISPTPSTRRLDSIDTADTAGTLGDPVGSDGSRTRIVSRCLRATGAGNTAATWERLFPNRMEAVALAVLLVADHGLNATTASEPPGPRATPDSGEGDFPVYRTELDKRRRGAGRHVETRDIPDFGANSPGHLITLALEATAHDRALVAEQAPELDRLLLRRTNRPCQGKRDDEARLGVIGVGPHHTAPHLWEQQVGRSGSPMRRLRKTVNVLHRLEPSRTPTSTAPPAVPPQSPRTGWREPSRT